MTFDPRLDETAQMGIRYAQLQDIVDLHPEGITSGEISRLIFDDEDKAHVTAVGQSITRGITKGILKVCKRRADYSIYIMWYPKSVEGIPITSLEKSLYELDSAYSVGQIFNKIPPIEGSRPLARLTSYLEAMAEDGTLEVTRGARHKSLYRWKHKRISEEAICSKE